MRESLDAVILRLCKIVIALVLALVLFLNIAPASALESDYFGMCVSSYLSDIEALEEECEKIIASGVKWVRISPEWGWFMPTRTTYDYSLLAKVDRFVEIMQDNDVEVLFILCFTARWASSQPEHLRATRFFPADIDDWVNYVEFITNRYKGKITAWEVWNEADYIKFWEGTSSEYFQLLQSAYTKVKQVDARNRVLIAGLTFADDYQLFKDILAMGAGNYFDIMNYHAYADTPKMHEKYSKLMEIIEEYPNVKSKKIWITETGNTTSGDANSEYNKADMLDQIYTLHKRYANVERIFWYCYSNTNLDDEFEDNFGLTDRDYVPLKALYHYSGSGGAKTDFAVQEKFPILSRERLTLTHSDGVFDGDNVVIPANSHLSIHVNDNWLYDANSGLNESVYIDVTYLSDGAQWYVEYDGENGAYSSTSTMGTEDLGRWATVSIELEDIKFANRQEFGSDFRICPMDNAVTIKDINVRKVSNRGTVILGEQNAYTLLKHIVSFTETEEAYNPPDVMGGSECRTLTGNDKYMYFSPSRGLVKQGDTNITIGIEFWNSGTDNFVLQYVSTEGTAYKQLIHTKTDTGDWEYVEFTIDDADFNGIKSYGADFRIARGSGNVTEYIRKVTVTRNDVPEFFAQRNIAQYGQSVYRNVTFTNTTGESRDAYVAEILYDSSNTIKDIKFDVYTVGNNTINRHIGLPTVQLDSGERSKVLAWESWGSLKSLDWR